VQLLFGTGESNWMDSTSFAEKVICRFRAPSPISMLKVPPLKTRYLALYDTAVFEADSVRKYMERGERKDRYKSKALESRGCGIHILLLHPAKRGRLQVLRIKGETPILTGIRGKTDRTIDAKIGGRVVKL
jgi:hypothetical protein